VTDPDWTKDWPGLFYMKVLLTCIANIYQSSQHLHADQHQVASQFAVLTCRNVSTTSPMPPYISWLVKPRWGREYSNATCSSGWDMEAKMLPGMCEGSELFARPLEDGLLTEAAETKEDLRGARGLHSRWTVAVPQHHTNKLKHAREVWCSRYAVSFTHAGQGILQRLLRLSGLSYHARTHICTTADYIMPSNRR